MRKNMVGLALALVIIILSPLFFRIDLRDEKVTKETIPIYFDDYLSEIAERAGYTLSLEEILNKAAEKAGDECRLEKIHENPENPKIFLAELKSAELGELFRLILIEFDNGLISYTKDLGAVFPNTTSVITLKGLLGNFILTYTCSSVGNGEARIIKFEKEPAQIGVFDVLDSFREDIEYPEIAEKIGISAKKKISFVFGEDDQACYLTPLYKDINGDGYDDVEFKGVQRVLDSGGTLLKKLNVDLIYLYDEKEGRFKLNEDKSNQPYGWRWQTDW